MNPTINQYDASVAPDYISVTISAMINLPNGDQTLAEDNQQPDFYCVSARQYIQDTGEIKELYSKDYGKHAEAMTKGEVVAEAYHALFIERVGGQLWYLPTKA